MIKYFRFMMDAVFLFEKFLFISCRETNLKFRMGLRVTDQRLQEEQQLAQFNGKISFFYLNVLNINRREHNHHITKLNVRYLAAIRLLLSFQIVCLCLHFSKFLFCTFNYFVTFSWSFCIFSF